jgi:orotate phosphoribosyltransferase
MSTPREELLTILAEKSFRLGQFKLSSGGTSDFYIDCRATTLDAEGCRLTGRVLYDEIEKRGWKPRAIGGLTLGADPLVVSVAVLSAQRLRGRSGVPGTPAKDSEHDFICGFLIRKEEKGHGTGQRIEGFREPQSPVVIVDDVCTTGASTIQAITVAREFGFEVIGVLCLVDREEADGRANIEKAAAPAPFAAIFTADEIRAEHVRMRLHEQDPLAGLQG